MIKQSNSQIEYYQSENLIHHKNVEHFFSTRKGDFSQLTAISNHFQMEENTFVIGKQTHGDCVAIVNFRNKNDFFENADAFITSEKGICIAVKTADCTPVLLFDPIKNVIAAIHSGWKGTVQNIVGKTVGQMVNHFGIQPQNLIAAIGPCISQINYEVGEEVATQFKLLFPNEPDLLKPLPNNGSKWWLNVRMAIVHQLTQTGVQPKRIDCNIDCTFENIADFHSARRDGAATGRMINGIFLK